MTIAINQLHSRKIGVELVVKDNINRLPSQRKERNCTDHTISFDARVFGVCVCMLQRTWGGGEGGEHSIFHYQCVNQDSPCD